MKALVYTGTMQSEIREVDDPDPTPDEVLVDLAFCGLCGSDMHAWHAMAGPAMLAMLCCCHHPSISCYHHHPSKSSTICSYIMYYY